MSQIDKEIRRFTVEPLELPVPLKMPVPLGPDYIPDEKPVVPVEEPVNARKYTG